MNIIDDLRQRHMIKWEESYFSDVISKVGRATNHHAVIVAAIRAGIITGLSVEEAEDLRPYEAEEIADKIASLINAAKEPPKKKKS